MSLSRRRSLPQVSYLAPRILADCPHSIHKYRCRYRRSWRSCCRCRRAQRFRSHPVAWGCRQWWRLRHGDRAQKSCVWSLLNPQQPVEPVVPVVVVFANGYGGSGYLRGLVSNCRSRDSGRRRKPRRGEPLNSRRKLKPGMPRCSDIGGETR